MKRLLLLTLTFAAVAVLASAQEPRRRSAVTSRIEQFHRNQHLVQHLVETGLDLAAAATPLDRVDQVQKIANVFADEIHEASEDQDGDRTRELCNHLRILLSQGVAFNLSAERKLITPDSQMYKELSRKVDRAVEKFRPLEEKLDYLRQSGHEDMAPALDAVRQGRKEIEKAFYGLERPATPKKS